MASGVKGLDEVMIRLNVELKRIHTLSTQGLIQAAIHVRRETETVAPVTPVDLGNLRASWFVVSTLGQAEDTVGSGNFRNRPGSKENLAQRLRADHNAYIQAAMTEVNMRKQPMVIMGYSAFYAAIVHEMIWQDFSGAWRKNKRGGGGGSRNAGPKWLEIAIKRNKKKIVSIVAGRIRPMYMTKITKR